MPAGSSSLPRKLSQYLFAQQIELPDKSTSINMTPPPSRKRAFLPKVKTGCRTCKARKIKCDQAKPLCRRCTSSNRTCSYQASASTSPDRQVEHSMSTWLDSDSEKRSFDFFLTRASQRLGGYFNNSFWSREILQAAIGYPSIRHLVVALGAAYEQFETQEPGNHDDDMRFALQQCNLSIRHLANSSPQSAEEMCCILTASVLFATFASLHSQMDEAIEHVRAGMRVLRNLDSLGVSAAFPVPVARLRSILTALYAQTRSMINDEAKTDWGGIDPLVSDIEPVAYFLCLADAQTYVETLFNNTLAFFQRQELFPNTTPKATNEAVDRHAKLCSALRNSCDALDAFVAHNSNEIEEKSLSVLRLYHTLLSVWLGLDRQMSRESSFDDFEDDLAEMLKYCRVISQDEGGSDDGTGNQHVLSSSGLGIIMPLHMVAARCRNPAVRQEAVRLLHKARRREWIWDSTVVEKIVSTTIELEQEGSKVERTRRMNHKEAGYQKVPDNARVREVKVQFEGERSARVVFITVGQWRNNQSGYLRFIKW